MPNWYEPMQQTFEYYVVDRNTWKDSQLLTNVKSCSITRDLETDTLGSASFELTDSLGECYVRVYLITIQNGVKERHPLGTFLVQTPSSSFDGMVRAVSVDAYTPLIELKENSPDLGFSILKDEMIDGRKKTIMEHACGLIKDWTAVPVVTTSSDKLLLSHFTAETDENRLTFLRALIAQAEYSFGLDDIGRIIFEPDQELDAMQAVTTFDDGNSSILYPEITMDHDLFGIPNVVEVIYNKDGKYIRKIVENTDPNSPVSIPIRGRRIAHRVVNPSFSGSNIVWDDLVEDYANKLLKSLSTAQYKLKYTHGYYPVRLRDCVRLNYERAGITNVKARIISQTIKCEPGCPVSETATFTNKLWEG